MESRNTSNAVSALTTVLTCSLAVILFGFTVYQSYTYPEETANFLSEWWGIISVKLSFVGTATEFTWFVISYPFIHVYQAIIGATSVFWIVLFCTYLWCSCISYHLSRKGITTGLYKGFDGAAEFFGFMFIVCMYIACFGQEHTFMSIVALTLLLFFKFMLVEILFNSDKALKKPGAKLEQSESSVETEAETQ
jgi:hypothetical protein